MPATPVANSAMLMTSAVASPGSYSLTSLAGLPPSETGSSGVVKCTTCVAGTDGPSVTTALNASENSWNDIRLDAPTAGSTTSSVPRSALMPVTTSAWAEKPADSSASTVT